MSHEKLCKTVKSAVREMFSDTSVSRETTRVSLEDIADHIQIYLDCLDEDDAEQRTDGSGLV